MKYAIVLFILMVGILNLFFGNVLIGVANIVMAIGLGFIWFKE